MCLPWQTPLLQPSQILPSAEACNDPENNLVSCFCRGDSSTLEDFKLPYCHSGPSNCTDLLSAVQTLRPTVLIGCDQTNGAPPFVFDQHVVGTMADNAHHPLIFPLTSGQPECAPQDAYTWSGGRAVVATCAQGQRAAVDVEGRELHPSQITSTYIFPGVGESGWCGVQACC